MKFLKDIDNWNGFIYQLIYPGIIGSMIYELLPASKDDLSNFFNVTFFTKLVITFFYCVDYLHLYGDIYKGDTKQIHSWDYLLCDFSVSLLFFLAFVFVKLEWFQLAIVSLAIVPCLFWIYKRKDLADSKFNRLYFTVSILVGLLLILNLQNIIDITFLKNSKILLLIFSLCSFITYVFYVFKYYEKRFKITKQKLVNVT